jgi:hypothetical protein
MADGFVSVSRRIEVPAEQLFAVLADSANHPLIDGSGMVRQPSPSVDAPESGRYRWGYQLAPDGADATMVTESFDCTRSDGDLREAVTEGEGWRDAMTASLVKLELLAKALGPA